ncbi:MAG TPA: sigma-54 dependent transcriptional regulator [Candidatus Cryosericum sp.]|nr:sigma-54 dependent transcriptional regulator [Candidatus Cryosericum sp.]
MPDERRRPRGRVLIVEDEAYVRASLDELLRARGFDVSLAAGVEEALVSLARAPVDVVLTDLKMPGGGGLELVRRVRASSPEMPVVVLTGHGTVPSAVECIKSGASDYLLKPIDPEALEAALDRALLAGALRREVAYLRGAAGTGDTVRIIGRSARWMQVMQMAQAVAATDSTVLLLGESGTGKELVARQIHALSRRSGGPYVRVNCAAIPVEMWESEFFGHRRGAFTGAAGDRDGRFRLAHRGTLFMDEVGAMPLPAQAKILRVLQDGEFDRLGDEQPTRVDVRVIAATNSDLEADVAAGRFRQDLYYRLDVVRMALPALRDRPDDIPLLIEGFLEDVSARLGRRRPGIAPATMAELQAYHWPGNVRELRNVLERALILNPGDTLAGVDLLPAPPVRRVGSADPRGPGDATGSGASGEPPEAGTSLREVLARSEKQAVIEALQRSGGVRKEAARLLGIDQRNLAYYFRKHGIDPDVLP